MKEETAICGRNKMQTNKKIPTMLRTLLSSLIACSFLMSLCLLAAPLASAAPEKTFTVGFDAEFPPYGYKDESGEYVGFDLDLAAEVCKRNGWELKKQPIDWDSKDMELDSGSIDCIWNGFTFNGREDKYTWTVPYVDNSQVVVVKADSDISKLSDLKGKVVAVQADSSALAAFTGDDAAEENKALAKEFSELQQVGDYNTAFLNLESGMVQAVCLDYGVAKHQISGKEGTYRQLEDVVSTEKYAVGFKLGNTDLRDKVQAALYEMKKDGTFDTIAKKWELQDSVCLVADESVINKTDSTSAVSKKDNVDVLSMTLQLLRGMYSTIIIFVLTLIFSMPLGLLLTFIRMSKFKPLQWLARIYISIMRGTPLMLQLLVVCFAPYYVLRINLGSSYRFYAVIIGFSLNYAAYFAEIFRAGIQSVPNGQREAASILGYSRAQTFGRIIFPQMIKNVLPPVTNEVITLVKDTSLAFALAYTELFIVAKQISAAQANIIPLFAAGLFYYLFNFVVAFVMNIIEKKLNYYR